MLYTSAQIAKMLSKLKSELTALQNVEAMSRTFLASVGEDPEDVRPEYDYAETKEKIAALEEKIRKIKHAVNVFNTVTVIPEFGMTIDEILVYIPQLSALKQKLTEMASVLPKQREDPMYGNKSNIIDYRYANYDIDAVRADLEAVTDKLAAAQLALDTVNHSAVIELDI